MEIFWARQGQFLSKNTSNCLIPRNQRGTKLTRILCPLVKCSVNIQPLKVLKKLFSNTQYNNTKFNLIFWFLVQRYRNTYIVFLSLDFMQNFFSIVLIRLT